MLVEIQSRPGVRQCVCDAAFPCDEYLEHSNRLRIRRSRVAGLLEARAATLLFRYMNNLLVKNGRGPSKYLWGVAPCRCGVNPAAARGGET